MPEKLTEYRRKRDFARTPEPPPAELAGEGRDLTFVVQKHRARRLHYDFRLEAAGVLKSWAIPKGPSYDPSEKRLAVMVEDHPLEYAGFEGVIPESQYGTGPVIVWDRGTYSPDDEGRLSFGRRREAEARMQADLERGKVSVFLRGRKLRGSWTLVRTARSGGKDWLLIKHRDEYAGRPPPGFEEERSVVSGRTVEEVAAGRSATAVGVGHEAPYPSRLEPMLATLFARPFTNAGWLFEPKLDGVRALAFLHRDQVTLRGRRGSPITRQYPAIADALARRSGSGGTDMVLDGEIVALDERGVPDFERLQRRMHLSRTEDIARRDLEIPTVYYVFDLLYLDGRDLTGLSLSQRKALLWSTFDSPDRSERVRYLDHVEGEGEAFFRATADMGIEGIVAKRKASTYQVGGRSRDWLKIKSVLSQEFVVGGYSEGQGTRRDSFGALLLGHYEGDRLLYAGNVGSGFSERQLAELARRLHRLESPQSPFAEAPSPGPAPSRWVRPELVAQVKFSQWTRDGRLRAPVFLGLRDDIDPRQVRREVAEPAVDVGTEPAQGDAPLSADGVLAQLNNDRDSVTLKLASHSLKLTNLNKELWPATSSHRAYTKRDLIRYYTRVSPYVLPHLRDRPLTLTRYPGGIASSSFYQKHWEHRLPPFAETVRLFSSTNKADVEYVLVNNLETLVWLAQLADIELHVWFSRIDPKPDTTQLPTTFTGSKQAIEASVLNYPDFLVFDLDPYIYSGAEKPGEEPELNRRAFARVKKVAGRLRELLAGLSLKPYLKTSGRTGLHVYVPVLRQYDFDVTRKACEAVGRFLVSSAPADVTVEWAVGKRTGKIFFDYNQNMRGKTVAAPYSLRPTPEATVSVPIAWEELRDVYPTDFTIETAPARLQALGDLWSDILESKHDFRALVEGEGGDSQRMRNG